MPTRASNGLPDKNFNISKNNYKMSFQIQNKANNHVFYLILISNSAPEMKSLNNKNFNLKN